MHRCYAPPEGWHGDRIALPAAEAHHLLAVLRARPGDRVRVFDGAGRQACAELLAAGDGAGTATLHLVEHDLPTADPDLPDLILAIAVPKGPRMDWIVEKAVELGAAAIWPVLTERCLMRWDRAQAAEKRARWERLALGAAKQCGAPGLPAVAEVCALDGLVARLVAETGVGARALLGALAPGAPLLRVALAGAAPRRVILLIGPEGDFTPAETERLCAAGARPVSFGDRILRVETAALFALAACVAAYQRG